MLTTGAAAEMMVVWLRGIAAPFPGRKREVVGVVVGVAKKRMILGRDGWVIPVWMGVCFLTRLGFLLIPLPQWKYLIIIG